MLKILVADDHPLFREALIGALQAHFPQAKFFEADSLDTSIQVLNQFRAISLILLDLNMPGGENFYGLLKLRQRYPHISIAVVSASEGEDVVSQAIEFGADAYIPKTTTTSAMVEVLAKILAGEKWLPEKYQNNISGVNEEVISAAEHVKQLTPKQFGVLCLLRRGLTNKQIAEELSVTEATVKAHISAIFRQFGVKSRTQVLVKIESLQLE